MGKGWGMMILYKSVGTLVAIYVMALIVVCYFQRSFLYFPSDVYVPPQSVGAGAFKEIKVKTEDHLDLTGWYSSATSKKFTIVFFHGNGDSLVTAFQVADPYVDAGYGFLLAEYRGYSGLSGSPTEEGLYSDARAYIRNLISSGVQEKDIVLLGHSLGTGVAVQMAKEFDVAKLVLFAPYTSMSKMAQIRFPIFPAEYLVLDKFDNHKKIFSVKEPLLIVSGAVDQVIPPAHGKTLFEAANNPKSFSLLEGRGHNDLFDEAAGIVLEWLQR